MGSHTKSGSRHMADYIVEIDGSRNLAQIELDIQGEELGYSQFKTIEIGTYGGKETNLVTFTEVETCPQPPVKVRKAGDPGVPPANGSELFTGDILSKNQRTNAIIYRA